MATTTNYSWTTPDDTDLVKDGAAAIRTLGSAIDTTVFNNAGAAIAKTIVDAKGDLIVATGADTPARLAVGTNGYILTADSAEASGVKWAAASAGGANFTAINSGGTALSGSQETTISGISGKDKIFIYWTGVKDGDYTRTLYLRLNADTTNSYFTYGSEFNAWNGSYSPGSIFRTSWQNYTTAWFPIGQKNDPNQEWYGMATLTGCNSSGVKQVNCTGGLFLAGYYPGVQTIWNGIYTGSSAISSITIRNSASNFSAGTVYVYASEQEKYMKIIERIFDAISGNITDVEREMTAQEVSEYEAEIAKAEAQQLADSETATKREAAEAKLVALGLTPEDLKALGLA